MDSEKQAVLQHQYNAKKTCEQERAAIKRPAAAKRVARSKKVRPA